MQLSQPSVLYRYQAFGTRSLDALCWDRIHFSDPASFNDPLDCSPTLENDVDVETLRNVLYQLVHRRVHEETRGALTRAMLSDNRADTYADERATQVARTALNDAAYNATNPELGDDKIEVERGLLTRDIENEMLARYGRGVCCFSETFSNPLLWSHYGDQHRGICIGYDDNRTPKPELHRVDYGGSRVVSTSLVASAVVDEDASAQSALDRAVLLRKASSWEYEQEWRLFGARGVQDSPLNLREVIFGMRCPPAVVHAVVSALDSRDGEVEFFQMKSRRGTFELAREPVDDELLHILPNTAMSGEEIFGRFVDTE